LRLNQWTALVAFTASVGFVLLFGLRDRGAVAESGPDESEPQPSEPDDYVAGHD
jgi:hypothetical protein